MVPIHKTQRFLFIFLTASLGFLYFTPAIAHNITFSTDFENPAAGPGTILDQSPTAPARIFQYVEDDLYATAIRNIGAESHYHLFGDGLLMGGDSEGVNFTFGGPTPTLPFNVESVEILELGTFDTFLTPWTGGTAGDPLQVTSTGTLNFNPLAWEGISHFTAAFTTPLPGDGSGARLVLANLDLHPSETSPKPVPEPSTLGLLGVGLIGLAYLRKKRKA